MPHHPDTSRPRSLGLSAVLLCLGLAAAPATHAASPEWETPATSHKDVKPYADVTALQAVVLPPPPAEGTQADRDDVAGVLARQQVDPARRASAELDGELLYDRFAPLLGIELKRERFPALISLLNRSVRQAGQPAFAAKQIYRRLRPYQRLTLSQVCGRSGGSKPDPDAQQRTSYPSGHSTYGWTTALVLARVAPDKAAALLARANEYADSRLICGMHFQSDVEAGRQLATAVVSQLDLNPEFQQDLQRARAELAAAR
ncbi:acid phosphatase (class A) [Roseateles sp. YR242]|uniref:acid phosphatase n=1 Tax=Roseateles sp. YR242 TaxID=1855305 RepID=UPI0008B62531|nr:phosphatase PAP2 family protein [Roseateles sp. YR242]SEL86424.1 acid phosphatase (class A) [Roseateles sp. YR242]